MDVTISEEQRREIHKALHDRSTELGKLREKNQEKGLFGAVIDADAHIRIIVGGPAEEKGLLALFAPEPERAQDDLFSVTPGQTVDEALEGIEEEAAKRLAGDPEFREAVAGIAPQPGSGIDSVTISSAAGEVTLTQEDGQRLRRRARLGV